LEKNSVLRRRLKTVNDVDEVTLDGRLFHTREAAAGNARSPIMEWRIGGTTSYECSQRNELTITGQNITRQPVADIKLNVADVKINGC